MADGGLCYFISYLINLMRCDNGSASNAISAKFFKTLAVIINDDNAKINSINNFNIDIVFSDS
ncbi:hypothetical protein A5893_13850 [Pedobacter psychrophilus]|uniref:Uncharacterized protein n=1 Tax=Pedobacter psychrophilus TaxID=1826909 RepID=A0A179DC61_9SPHI|nr:hypothetical protein A5893_13850 [Pedobacter psychrophilus]